MNDIKIKEFSLEDKESSIELLKSTFPGASNEETFKWRYESFEKLKPLIIVAKEGEKVVSFVSWMPWIFNYKNRKLIGYQTCEGATHPEFRKLGLLTKMLFLADDIAKKKEIDFYFNFPSAMSYGPTFRAGYTPIIKFNFFKKILLPKIDQKIIKTNSTFSETNFIVGETDISTEFNKYYYDWRFLYNPAHYDNLVYEENNNKALFILRSNKDLKKKFGIFPKKIMLVDFQTTSYFEDFLQNSFNYLFNYYRNKASYIATFFNEKTIRGSVIKTFFKSKANLEPRILCVKPICFDNKNILFNSKLWDLMPHAVDYY